MRLNRKSVRQANDAEVQRNENNFPTSNESKWFENGERKKRTKNDNDEMIN